MLLPRLVLAMLFAGMMSLAANPAISQGLSEQAHTHRHRRGRGRQRFFARLIAQGISGPLGQPVIVDNRATGVIAAEAVAKAPPDGYTLLVHGSTVWIAPLVAKDALRCGEGFFTDLAGGEGSLIVLVVHPSVPVKSVKELIALAKARPGELNYASGGTGPGNVISRRNYSSPWPASISCDVPYKSAGTAQ